MFDRLVNPNAGWTTSAASLLDLDEHWKASAARLLNPDTCWTTSFIRLLHRDAQKLAVVIVSSAKRVRASSAATAFHVYRKILPARDTRRRSHITQTSSSYKLFYIIGGENGDRIARR